MSKHEEVFERFKTFINQFENITSEYKFLLNQVSYQLFLAKLKSEERPSGLTNSEFFLFVTKKIALKAGINFDDIDKTTDGKLLIDKFCRYIEYFYLLI